MAHIYKVTSPSGKVYIGSSTNIKRRFEAYRSLQCKMQRKLYGSLLKYGSDAHIFEIVCECDEKDMFNLEIHYGKLFDVLNKEKGLNLSLPKNGDEYKTISDETRERFRKRQLGVKPSAETIEKRASQFRGKRRDPLTVQKVADANRGKKRTPEQNAKNGALRKGTKHTPETIKKMSDAHTGQIRDEVYRENIRKHRLAYWDQRGRVTPEQVKAKQRKAYLKRKASGYYSVPSPPVNI